MSVVRGTPVNARCSLGGVPRTPVGTRRFRIRTGVPSRTLTGMGYLPPPDSSFPKKYIKFLLGALSNGVRSTEYGPRRTPPTFDAQSTTFCSVEAKNPLYYLRPINPLTQYHGRIQAQTRTRDGLHPVLPAAAKRRRRAGSYRPHERGLPAHFECGRHLRLLGTPPRTPRRPGSRGHHGTHFCRPHGNKV